MENVSELINPAIQKFLLHLAKVSPISSRGQGTFKCGITLDGGKSQGLGFRHHWVQIWSLLQMSYFI